MLLAGLNHRLDSAVHKTSHPDRVSLATVLLSLVQHPDIVDAPIHDSTETRRLDALDLSQTLMNQVSATLP